MVGAHTVHRMGRLAGGGRACSPQRPRFVLAHSGHAVDSNHMDHARLSRPMAGTRWRHAWLLLMGPLALNAATGPWLMAKGDALDGAMLTGFCLLAAALTWEVRRTGSWLLWFIPLNFLGVTAVMAMNDLGLMSYYAGVTILCALGAFLATGRPHGPALVTGPGA